MPTQKDRGAIVTRVLPDALPRIAKLERQHFGSQRNSPFSCTSNQTAKDVRTFFEFDSIWFTLGNTVISWLLTKCSCRLMQIGTFRPVCFAARCFFFVG